ncbi:DUF4127 family protein [Paenibacillus sp. J22TS3]|uniref:DUF4127 family protein n=1 Tax=Paenibacillus sp. J22TS3 TaxID=2807192 RepID=UPI001B0F0F77|nr:DUF4127 family protein [Paenibacillus sp. J22TS3]GIP20106.1 hypothetical protein J22TS3_03810 [Paenibacillus sp. J22TS3]
MKKILYVPIDDRPVNLDDVIRQGQAAGLKLITPCTEDIENRLDSVALASGDQLLGTSTPTFGNSSHIRKFILNNASSADGFILSTDMLAYGGLIGSRRLRTSGGGTYPEYDSSVTHLLDVIRKIKQAYPNKPVFVFDTIMRLATTTYVEGLTSDASVESRNFMGLPRKSYTEFDDILNNYNESDSGTQYGETTYFDKIQYYNTRQHKFKTNYYVLDQLARQGYIDFLAVGVDDAKTQGVQINEIRFIENYINSHLGGRGGQNPDRAIILPDADGLGHSLVARMANHLYLGGRKPKYSVQYYGPEGSTIINPYEYMNVHDNIVRHVDIIGGQFVTDSPDVEIIAITSSDEVPQAVSRIETNGSERRGTVVVDFVGQGPASPAVTEAMLGSPSTGLLLGYSGWNTAGNKIGIALGMGQSRYAFLVSKAKPSVIEDAVDAHGSLLFKRFLKDYYYKAVAISDIRAYSRSHSKYANLPQGVADQNMVVFNSTEDYNHLLTLLRDLMQTHTETLRSKNAFGIGTPAVSHAVRQIKGSSWNLAEYKRAHLDYCDPNYIWGRAFEITLNPTVDVK